MNTPYSTIETVHRCRIAYDMYGEDSSRIDDFIKKVENFASRLGDIDVETFSGNAAFSPWVLLECDNRTCLENAVLRLENYIQRWRGSKLE